MKSTLRSLFSLALLLMATVAPAATIPVLEDSFGFRAKLTVAANKATTLPVDANHRAFLFFELRDLPAGATIRSARLRLFLPRVVRPGVGLELHTVTGTWDETLASAEPAFAAAPLATIPAVSLRTKGFVTVDITALAQAWVANPPSNEGLAITAVPNAVAKSVTSVTIGAKEGSGSGYPAELDVELDAAPVTGVALGTNSITLGSGTDPSSIKLESGTDAHTFISDTNGFRLERAVPGTTRIFMNLTGATNDFSFGFGGRLISRGNGSVSIDGAFSLEATTLTGDFTANNATCVFFCNTNTTSITVTLPTPSAAGSGRVYILKKISASNTLTITPPGGFTIDGAASIALTANNAFRVVMSSGSNWFVVGQ